MEANKKSNLLKFRQKCIFDYTFFIATFFRLLDSPNKRKYSSDAIKFIMNYLYFKKIEEDLPLSNINRNNLQSLLTSYGGDLLTGQYFYLEKAGGAPKKSLLSVNLTGISHNNEITNRNRRSPNSNTSTIVLGSKNSSLSSNSFELRYPNTFNNTNYDSFNESTGVQSTMKVNTKNNPSYYFKTIDSKNPAGSLNALKNECKIFEYLNQKNQSFLDNCTCFFKCFKNGILLRNGGIVLSSQLQSKTFVFNEQNIKNLFNFFSILLELHKLLITHNDLKVDNIVGFDRNNVRIIDFGQSEIHLEEYYDESFFNHINRVFKVIFFALLRKYGFIQWS